MIKTLQIQQTRNYFQNSWRKIKLQNPNLVRETNSINPNNKSLNASQHIYVCGSALLGALGLSQYYKPKQEYNNLDVKDIQASTLKKLSVFSTDCKILDIECGYGFTLVVCKLSKSSHTAFGFGINSYSQIGYHSSRPGYPLEVVYTPSPIHVNDDIMKASCGRSHSILLSKSGKVYSLGNNSLGQCGRKIVKDEVYFGSKVVHKLQCLPNNITSIECGQDHSFFLSSAGELYSCGWGADGQTGLGHYNAQEIPTQIKSGLENVKLAKISSFADTALALDEKGNLFGWGNSEYGQFRIMADSDSEQFNRPIQLKTSSIPGKIVDIATGGTMCLVLNDRGDVYVWGFGILGLGPKVDQTSKPLKIPETLFGRNELRPDVKVTKIFASLSHFAAINNKGELYTWGKNRYGCLGLAHSQDQYFPWKVDTNLASIKDVALGINHMCVQVSKEFC